MAKAEIPALLAGSGIVHSSEKAQLDNVSRVTGWVLHDLRRTLRTGLARFGIPLVVAEAAINRQNLTGDV